MKIKPGVNILGLKPETIIGAIIVNDYFNEIGKEFVITSAIDSKHKWGSLHYQGLAFDVRTRHLDPDKLSGIVIELKSRLAGLFDVVLESDHIHVEYQPKKPVND